MQTTLDLVGASGIPKLRGNIEFGWDWNVGEKLPAPGIGLTNLEVELGSYVDKFLTPIAEEIRNTLDPVMPVINVLTQEVPGLDVITDDNTVKGLINLLLQLKGRSPIDWSFINEANQVYGLVGVIANLKPDEWLPLGDIAGLGTPNPTSIATTKALPVELQQLEQTLKNNTRTKPIRSSGTNKTPRSGFQVLPYLKDISNWTNLLSGEDATLFTYELPLLEFTTQLEVLLFSYGIPGIASIDINAIARLSAMADIGFGYDTFGVRQAIDTGNPLYALDGFFVSDWDLTTQEEKDEFKFKGSIGLGGSLDIAVASVGAEGLVSLNVGADLQDIEKSTLTKNEAGFVTDVTWQGDGKIRGSEIATMLSYPNGFNIANVQNLFNIDGSINFELDVVGEVGIGWFSKSFRENLLDYELYGFSFDAPKVKPTLAEKRGDVLFLNAGDRAGNRKFGSTEDGGEAFYLYTDIKTGKVGVEFDGYYQTFDGVTKIVANGGQGDDTFDASRLQGVEVELNGQAGNDTLIAGTAGGILSGGAGDDNLDTSNSIEAISAELRVNATLKRKLQGNNVDNASVANLKTAYVTSDPVLASAAILADPEIGRNSNLIAFATASSTTTGNQLLGGEGDDAITGGSSIDIIDGGAGNDQISGGAGKDYLDGGQGADSVAGDDGDDELVIDNDFGNDRWNENDPGGVFDFSAVTDNLAIAINEFNLTVKKIDENGELLEGEQEIKVNRSADSALNIRPLA